MQLPLHSMVGTRVAQSGDSLGSVAWWRHMAGRPGFTGARVGGFERKVCCAGSLLCWLSEASGPACAVQEHVSCLVVAVL